MANIGPLSIRFSQRNSTNTAYNETYVSGSNLFVITDDIGNITGSKNLPDANFTTITASNASFGTLIVNSVTKLFGILYAYAGVVGDITGSLSGSNVTATNIVTTNLTASYISGSITNAISSSYSTVAQTANSLNISNSYQVVNLTSSNVKVTNSGSFGSLQSNTGSFYYLSINNTGSAPVSSSSSGSIGEIRVDNNFIYIYTNQNWLRVPIAQWKN
jgi:hypothetical protein